MSGKPGRRSLYTEQLAAEILDRLADGESLRAICRAEGMPSESTVRAWAQDDRPPGFAARYAYARNVGLDCLADEILEIAYALEVGERVIEKPTGNEIHRGDMIEHRRLKIDALKWYLAKLAPKKYGDRQTVELGTDDGFAARLDRALTRSVVT